MEDLRTIRDSLAMNNRGLKKHQEVGYITFSNFYGSVASSKCYSNSMGG